MQSIYGMNVSGDGSPQSQDALRQVDGLICDICGKSTFSIHCKLMCSNCGYTRDCSDY